MNKEIIKSEINVMRIGNKEYISLTDLARYVDEDDPRYLFKTGCVIKMLLLI